MTEFIPITGGPFQMGSDRHYSEEAPEHRASVKPFELAATSVTNQEFATFVESTGYVTVAERSVPKNSFPGAENVEPGSIVFTPTTGPVDLGQWQQWWRWIPGASWKHPFGPDTDLRDKEDYPVVQIAYEDAYSFAAWAGARLPIETEWEFAARGGIENATYAWGEEPNDGSLANTWQGRFPYENLGANGWVYSAPVGSFPANAFGLYEMTGNVWEWTSSVWTPRHGTESAEHISPSDGFSSCSCSPARLSSEVDQINSAASSGAANIAPQIMSVEPASKPAHSSRVLKGGSHLCSPDYCLRYRPAARSPQTEDSATTHIGFRLARSV